MDVERSLIADEAMDIERSLSLTSTIDNGVPQSAGGSLIWHLRLPSRQHNLAEEEEEEDDDDESAGYPTEEIVLVDIGSVVIFISLLAQRLEVDFETAARLFVFGEGGHCEGGVPASDAAVAGLEKLAFHATGEGCDDCECGGGGVKGCAICLEDFDDGEEVTVMPCSRGHEFHHDCITKWLGKSNTCPLCRHALPTDVVDDGGL